MGSKVCNYFQMSMTSLPALPPPPAPLPAPLPTPKYNRLKHSLTDCMTACQSCVLGETSEAEQLSGDEASAPAADEEEWII